MSIEKFIEQTYENDIRAHQTLDPEEANFSPFPEALPTALSNALKQNGIDQLYSHQVESFEHIHSNRNTVLVTRTASGKTLSFFLPILSRYMDEPFGVLLLYPTKALSRDQEGSLGKLLEATVKRSKMGTFDGDTPREERTRIAGQADFVITNPDMLHNGILPNHQRRWRSFLSRLKYIVVDEVHTYRGSFGSHVSNVFRRLQRICEFHGSSPTIVCSSATSGNPKEHVEGLFRRPFELVNNDGSPRPKRNLYFINPPMVKSAGDALYRKGTGSVSIRLIREAAKQGIRCICFCRARQEVERLHRAVLDKHPDLRNKVKPYRGGLLPTERRQLERDLFDGRICCIITTNALELGIDVGGLDLCILSGHPGSLSAFWQQAGRVGRGSREATIVFVAKDSPVDQYLVHHPEFVSETPIERAWINGDNPYILLQHLPCAAHEHPIRQDEPLLDGMAFEEGVEVLKEDGTLRPYGDTLRYSLKDYPAKGVNLRGMTDYNIEIFCGTEVIGELDPIGARGTLYKDAIYQHLGQRYMSMELDLEKKLCRVDRVNVDYYTEAVWESRVEITEIDEESQKHGHSLQFGAIHCNQQPKLYKKIRERSLENIGYGPITLDPFEYDTTGMCIRIAKDWQVAMKDSDIRFIAAGTHGLSTLLKLVAPSLCMADRGDLETDVSLSSFESDGWNCALFLFDSVAGGVGYGEKVFELLPEVWSLCLQILEECECEAGCPACVPTMPPGVDDADLADLLVESNASVECTKSLLTHLLHGQILLPEIKSFELRLPKAVAPEPQDPERIKTRTRLERANRMLKKNREREH